MVEDWRAAPLHNQYAYTAVLDGKVLACAGVIINVVPTVGIAWAVLGDDIMQHHRIWATKMVIRGLEDVVRAAGLERLETVVLNDSRRNQRWIELMGFERDRTYIRYTKRTK